MTIAATRSGKVEGIEREGVHVFRGIPYAAPPVGTRRWRPPQREDLWDGVRDAVAFSAQSAQTEFGLTKLLGGTRPPYSEDSLYLNVWTPACDDTARPVMVWIHGGAFVWGAGDTPWYDGTNFATRGDVVVVTINYRLGPFGFMHLGDRFDALTGSGNLGLLDQIAALEWVRECIASFGGDPNRVTIFGESAGGASVSTLLGMPAARGLFAGAVAQSGAASWTATPEQATVISDAYLSRLGVRAGDLDALLAVSTDAILDAFPNWSEDGVQGLPFQPVIDEISLPRPPLDAIAAGNADGVSVLTGTNRHELTLFQLSDAALASLDDDGVRARLAHFCDDRSDAVLASYRSRRLDATPQQLWLDLATDAVFRIPAITMLEAQRGHGSTYAYFFTWETPVFGGFLRSTHALEIPFVFDNLARGGSEMFTGTGPERQGIADAMHRAWIAFAHNGDPSHGGLPAWPEYDVPGRATMRFDTTSKLLHDPAADDRIALAAALG
jgi:para-nitrobenzyl esterase